MIKFKRLFLNAVAPKAPENGDAGYDFSSYGVHELYPHRPRIVKSGIAVEIPKGYVGLLIGRSGHNFNHDMIATTLGIIDSSYRGDIQLKMVNNGYDILLLEHGDRFAQLVIVPCLGDALEEVYELSESTRGDKGFGSSGR